MITTTLLLLSIFFTCKPASDERRAFTENELFEYQSKMSQGVLQELVDSTLVDHDGQHIIHIGCHTGAVSRWIAQAHPNTTVTAIDQNEEWLQYAQEHNKEKNLTFIQDQTQTYNLLELHCPLPPAHLIVCHHTLHWHQAEQIKTIIKNISSSLSPGGLATIITAIKQKDNALEEACYQAACSLKWGPVMALSLGLHAAREALSPKEGLKKAANVTKLSSHELAYIAEQAGLKIKDIKEIESSAQFCSRKAFEDWLAFTLNRYKPNMLSSKDLKSFASDAAESYCEATRQVNSEVKYTFKELHAVAYKP